MGAEAGVDILRIEFLVSVVTDDRYSTEGLNFGEAGFADVPKLRAKRCVVVIVADFFRAKKVRVVGDAAFSLERESAASDFGEADRVADEVATISAVARAERVK